MKRFLLAAAVMIAMTGTALAEQCPKLMAQIDAAMAAGPTISPEQQAEVMKLRSEGEARHAAGRHAEAEVILASAKEILGLK
jgi:hypothetical protein